MSRICGRLAVQIKENVSGCSLSMRQNLRERDVLIIFYQAPNQGVKISEFTQLESMVSTEEYITSLLEYALGNAFLEISESHPRHDWPTRTLPYSDARLSRNESS